MLKSDIFALCLLSAGISLAIMADDFTARLLGAMSGFYGLMLLLKGDSGL